MAQSMASRRQEHRRHRRRALLATAAGGVAHANTSHDGWPKIDGVLKMNKDDGNGTMSGTGKSDELLGGHDSDTIYGRDRADVLWGDYKPSGQGTAQVDRLFGGAGSDFIYASHGQNIIVAGSRQRHHPRPLRPRQHRLRRRARHAVHQPPQQAAATRSATASGSASRPSVTERSARPCAAAALI